MGYFQLLKSFDAFKQPVNFFFNRRNRKLDKKVFSRQLGSIFGFALTCFLVGLMAIFFIHLFVEGIWHGRMNNYNSYKLDNNY
jgi:hypothetical protein